MTIVISEFVLGIITTILAEIGAFIILSVIVAINHKRKTHQNTSK